MNLKPIFFIVTILLSGVFCVNAQQAEFPSSLSLEDAVRLAIAHSPVMEQKNRSTQIAAKKVEESRWQRIPDIYANFDLRYNAVIPTTPVPAKAFNPNAGSDEILPLKFMTKWRSNAGVNFEYDVFNPGKQGKTKEALQNAAISKMDERITKTDLIYNIQQDYVVCLIAQEQLALAVADTFSKQQIVVTFQDKYELGRLTVTELNNARLEKNNALSSYWEAQKIYANSLGQLVNDMGYDVNAIGSVTLSEHLNDLLSVFQKGETAQPMSSQTLQKLELERTLSEIQLKNTRMGFLPTVSLNGFWGANYFSNRLEIFNDPFWYGNTYFGLNVTLPITRGLDRVKKAEELRLQIKQNEADYRIQKNSREQELARFRAEIDFRKRDLVLKEINKELSRINFQESQDLLDAGRLLVADWSKSNLQNLKSGTEYLQAVYNYLIAVMELQKVSVE